MQAQEVIDHLEALGTWVDWNKTRDIVLAGDVTREIERVGVTWVATMACVHDAVARGIDLLITHENPFYAPSTDPHRLVYRQREEKRALIEESGMVVYRCHDVWDKVPGVGVADCWAKILGLPCTRKVESYIQHARVEPVSVRDFARRVAAALAPYGEESVWVVGDLDAQVREVGLGTGAATDVCRMLEQPCDVCIVADDGISNFHDVQLAIDAGVPLIVVNHACCEKPGIDAMVAYLADAFPGLDVARLSEGYVIHAIMG